MRSTPARKAASADAGGLGLLFVEGVPQQEVPERARGDVDGLGRGARAVQRLVDHRGQGKARQAEGDGARDDLRPVAVGQQA